MMLFAGCSRRGCVYAALRFPGIRVFLCGGLLLLIAGCRPAEDSASSHVTTTVIERAGDATAGMAGDGQEPGSGGEPESRPGGLATTAGEVAGKTLPDPRRAQVPIRRGAINDITFDDLELDMPLGTLFDRSMLTPRAAALDGQQVRIRGFIFAGGVFQQTGIASFPLVKNTQCKFGPEGLAYCVMLVELDDGITTEFTTYPVTVEGRLSVRPYNAGGFTWSVYHLQGHKIF